MKRKEPSFKYKHVMLLDDSELDNYINEKMMEANHFSEKVYINTSGKSALEFLKNMVVAGPECFPVYPQVIFVDINMPFMDGFEFIQHLKKLGNDELKKCKLVILTSSIDEGDQVKAKQIDPNITFLSKPLTEAMLKAL